MKRLAAREQQSLLEAFSTETWNLITPVILIVLSLSSFIIVYFVLVQNPNMSKYYVLAPVIVFDALPIIYLMIMHILNFRPKSASQLSDKDN